MLDEEIILEKIKNTIEYDARFHSINAVLEEISKFIRMWWGLSCRFQKVVQRVDDNYRSYRCNIGNWPDNMTQHMPICDCSLLCNNFLKKPQ